MEKPIENFLLNISLTLACCLLIFILSAPPSPENIANIPHIDKVVHFGVYGILAVLFFRTFESPLVRMGLKTAMVLGILSSALYGVSDEIHQHFVPYRHADLCDVAADFLGSVFGVCTYRYLAKRRPRIEKPG